MASEFPTISSESDPLARSFADWRASGRIALIPYLTAGYPEAAGTARLLEGMVRAGADIIELGIPFSDPVADGPTIQRASMRALENGVNVSWVLDRLREFRSEHDTPVVLFTYLNPLLRYGVDRFIEDAVAAGAQGVLITDLPAGGDPAVERSFELAPLALIRLVAPTTPPARIRVIAERAQGFLYYVARLGVTGAGARLRPELAEEIRALQAASPVPVAVGFGISTAAHAAAVGHAADGVIVGSALIDALDRGGADAMEELLRGMRDALDGLGAGTPAGSAAG
jgi:tryptophan synthase alpha chain